MATILFSTEACGKSEEKKIAGEGVSDAINKAVDQAGQAMEKPGETMKNGVKDMVDKGKEVAKEVGDKMKEGKR